MTPLPDAWVTKIFARMEQRYGDAWDAMWDGIDMNAVRQDWAEELAEFQAQPEAIAYGLAHLPQAGPPTVAGFYETCRGHLPQPEAETNAPEPVLKPKIPKPTRQQDDSPLAWAHRLRAREVACEPLTPAQRQAWRDVLGN